MDGHRPREWQSGLVQRRPNPNDRRAQQLYLTPAADRLLEEINRLGASLTDTAMAGLGPRDRERLITLLGRVKRNLLEPAPDTDSAALRRPGSKP